MLQNRTFMKKTKQGGVRKIVREHYLRDDLYCGAPFCKACDVSSARLSGSASRILVVDTNIVLNQIDLLENPAIDDVVVLSIVLKEVKNKNIGIYNRLRALCSNSSRNFFVFSNQHHSRLVDPLISDFRNMNALAKIMRQRRIDRGALTLASAEVKFQINTETHDPLDIG